MGKCDNLEPNRVFYFFEEISKIPHGSRNTKAISDYLVNFAKERNLFYTQDEKNNVIIIKDATKGYENAEPVIMQGHTDMVCEKDGDTIFDFTKDPLKLYIDGDFLKAEGTTLGGDDGIAVAYALAILDSSTIDHPRFEAVFTVDEEIGMLGAEAIDLSVLKGKQMLNIDYDIDGTFLTSCAGGLRADCRIPVSYSSGTGTKLEIKVQGLMGGHSGSEIDKERANGILLLGRTLKYLKDRFEFSLIDINGGLQDNAIPREAICHIAAESNEVSKIIEAVQGFREIAKNEYHNTENGLTILCNEEQEGTYDIIKQNDFVKVLFLLNQVPNGIMHMSTNIENLVETSLNVGIMRMDEAQFRLSFAVRSSVTSRKYEVTEKLVFLTEFLGGEVSTSGDYPAWEYQEKSELREKMKDIYQELFNIEPKIEAVHAGLECGIFSAKIKDLDCISLGPDMFDIHTPKERLSISSTERIWRLLVEFLRRANK